MEVIFLVLAVAFFFLWSSKKKSSGSKTRQDIAELSGDESLLSKNIKAIGPTFICDFITVIGIL